MSKDITEEILLNAGFHKEEIYSIVCPYRYAIKLSNVYVEVYNSSNMHTRNFNIKVFNSYGLFADVDIETVEHFNKLMDLMDIDFKLKE